jgi:hypothetical protein
MNAQFSASQSVDLILAEQEERIAAYLRQPERLLRALINPDQLSPLAGQCFRYELQPLNFLVLRLQPSVDLRVWTDEAGVLRLKSIDARIRGLDLTPSRFGLTLQGELAPRRQPAAGLQGCVQLQVEVDVPPILQWAPPVLIENTGNALLRGVLLSLRQRLERQLRSDFQQWHHQSPLPAA